MGWSWTSCQPNGVGLDVKFERGGRGCNFYKKTKLKSKPATMIYFNWVTIEYLMKLVGPPPLGRKGHMRPLLSVGQYTSRSVNSFSQNRLIGFFLKFYMKLEGIEGQKLTKPNFSEKFSFLWKPPKISSKTEFFSYCQKFNPLMSFLTKKWCISVLYNSAKTSCLGKIWLFSYGLKCSQAIRLQDSLIINISGRNLRSHRFFAWRFFDF